MSQPNKKDIGYRQIWDIKKDKVWGHLILANIFIEGGNESEAKIDFSESFLCLRKSFFDISLCLYNTVEILRKCA